MQIKGNKYRINPELDSMKKVALRPKNKTEAKQRVELLLQIKDNRINELRKLFPNIHFDYSRESLAKLETSVFDLDFVNEYRIKSQIQKDIPLAPGDIRFPTNQRKGVTEKTTSLIEDIKYYLGDCLIYAIPDLYWSFNNFSKSINGYYKTGITGPSLVDDQRHVESVDVMYQPLESFINDQKIYKERPNPLTSEYDKIMFLCKR